MRRPKGWRENRKYDPNLKRRVAPEHRRARLKSIKPHSRAKSFYPTIVPVPTNVTNKEWLYGDFDHDGVRNIDDCHPLDPHKQDLKRVFKTNPERTVENYKRLAEIEKKKTETMLAKRQKERMLQSDRPRGQRLYLRELKQKGVLPEGKQIRDLREEAYPPVKPQQDNTSHRLQRLGYRETQGKMAHESMRKAISKTNYRKGLDTQWVYVGGKHWVAYTRPIEERPQRPPPQQGERTQWGITRGTTPRKPKILRQTKLYEFQEEEYVPMRSPQYYKEHERDYENKMGERENYGELIVPPEKIEEAKRKHQQQRLIIGEDE